MSVRLTGCGVDPSVPCLLRREGNGVAEFVGPARVRADEPWAWRVEGVPSGARVLIETTTTAVDAADPGAVLVSTAVFEADDAGVVDPATVGPIDGSYDGVDPFGLQWGRQPMEGRWPAPPSSSVDTSLSASVDGQVVASGSVTEYWYAEGVTWRDVREHGLVGRLFTPPAGTGPAVLAYGGSEGGLRAAHSLGPILAAHGFVVFGVAYFAETGLPPGYFRIPLEYFHNALGFLLAQPEVTSSQAGVLGASKGGELSLALGAHFPEVGAVVAIVPSGVATLGGPPELGNGSTWTLGGDDLPYLFRHDSGEEARRRRAAATMDNPIRRRDFFDAQLAVMTDAQIRRAEFPIERTRGPILMVSGEQDALWPSVTLGEIAVNRADRTGFRDITHVRYPEGGHLLSGMPGEPRPEVVVHPVTNVPIAADGGRPGGSARAAADSWPRIFAFLQGALNT